MASYQIAEVKINHLISGREFTGYVFSGLNNISQMLEKFMAGEAQLKIYAATTARQKPSADSPDKPVLESISFYNPINFGCQIGRESFVSVLGFESVECDVKIIDIRAPAYTNYA